MTQFWAAVRMQARWAALRHDPSAPGREAFHPGPGRAGRSFADQLAGERVGRRLPWAALGPPARGVGQAPGHVQARVAVTHLCGEFAGHQLRVAAEIHADPGAGELGALCVSLNAVGFTSRSLRAQVSRLLGVVYTPSQMSYDLGRLRVNGLIERIEGTNTYLPTRTGSGSPCSTPRSTTGCCDHYWPPMCHRPRPDAALRTIDRHVHGYIDDARLGSAA